MWLKHFIVFFHSLLLAAQLFGELSQLNLNFPARVAVPFRNSDHQVVRIPSSEAVVLNSKTKVCACVCVRVCVS